MVSVEIAEVSGLAVEVDHICEVYGVTHESSSVHEVVSYLIARQQSHLNNRISTRMGPIRLRLPLKLLEKMIKR